MIVFLIIIETRMGIKFLNKVLRSQCQNAIKKIHFGELQWKKIAVDISIYMYKFKGDHALMEQMYLMISIFRHYNIVPIFVFDGKPPEEKRELLNQRKEQKRMANINYELLKEQLDMAENEEDKQALTIKMNIELRKTTKITQTDIVRVKQLISALGVTYCEAPGEADGMCAYLVHKKLVYGCMSEDMDMFVYGCDRVFRYVSLSNRTCIFYDLPRILQSLEMSFQEFKEVCILAGTDYNIDSNEMNLYNIIKYFKKYKKQDNIRGFVTWMLENDKIETVEQIESIHDMFNMSNKSHISEICDTLVIKNVNVNKVEIESLLKSDNFIFI